MLTLDVKPLLKDKYAGKPKKVIGQPVKQPAKSRALPVKKQPPRFDKLKQFVTTVK